MYGAGRGGCAMSYFVRETKKATWFTQIPVMLSIIGTPDFGQQWSAKISKSGDYLLNSWLQFKLPPISTASTTQIDTSLNPVLSTGSLSSGDAAWVNTALPNVSVDRTTGDGGSGTGIQFTIVTGGTGDVTMLQLTNPGVGYRPGDVITIDGGPRTSESIRNPARPSQFEVIFRGLGGTSGTNDLRITLPQDLFSNWYASVKWCDNIAHNIIRECSLTCNDLVVARFDNYVLDFLTRFLVPYGKMGTYYNMIDNTYAGGQWDPFTGANGPSDYLTLPLPFFFSRDSGLALPTASLPYNDLRIRFDFRNWDELLILVARNSASEAAQQHVQQRFVPRLSDIEGACAPTLRSVQVWGHYALVTNDERKRMNCARRQMLIEQTLTSPIKPFVPFVESQPVFNLNMMHSIKMLFFGARNTTLWNDWSNYTTASVVDSNVGYYGRDPFENVTLLYEGTSRLSEMQINYFTQIQQYLYSPDTVSSSYPTGIYFYSYAMDGINVDPTGTGWGNGVQRYEFVAVGVCNNVLLIDGGSMRFAVM